ncbi:unnamed protein product [Arctogadus glacialis]
MTQSRGQGAGGCPLSRSGWGYSLGGGLLPTMLWCSGSYLIPSQTLAVFCPPAPLLLSTISSLPSQMFSLPALRRLVCLPQSDPQGYAGQMEDPPGPRATVSIRETDCETDSLRAFLWLSAPARGPEGSPSQPSARVRGGCDQ